MVTQHAKRVGRLRRQAISNYIADHREDLLKLLLPAHLSDRNAKRRELERVGRVHFNREPSQTQGQYMDKVIREEIPAQGAPEPQSQERGVPGVAEQMEKPTPEKLHRQQANRQHRGVPGVAERMEEFQEFRSSGEAASSSGDAAQTTTCTSQKCDPVKLQASTHSPKRLRTSQTVDSHWKLGQATSALHDQLIRCTKSLRAIYGDATTFEILAVATRMLDHVDMESEMFRRRRTAVKLAAVVGVAAKQMHSSEQVTADHVIRLWAKIAGKSSEPQVREVEKVFVAQWARQC